MWDNWKGWITTIKQDNCEHIFDPYSWNYENKSDWTVSWYENKNVSSVYCKKCLIRKII